MLYSETMPRQPRLILFAHPRSGSTSLMRVLQAHPALSILHEPFNESFTQWAPNNKDYRALIHDIASLDVQLEGIFGQHNGFKMLDYQLADELNAHLLQRTDHKLIFLRRRNLLQAVVSVQIAHQTNIWQKSNLVETIDAHYANLKPLDIAEVQGRVAELKRNLDWLEGLVDARRNGTSLKFNYEDLYFAPPDSQQQQLTTLWHWLGLEPLPWEAVANHMQPEAAQINTARTYALLPNADEIQRACGNAETGWLFD